MLEGVLDRVQGKISELERHLITNRTLRRIMPECRRPNTYWVQNDWSMTRIGCYTCSSCRLGLLMANRTNVDKQCSRHLAQIFLFFLGTKKRRRISLFRSNKEIKRKRAYKDMIGEAPSARVILA